MCGPGTCFPGWSRPGEQYGELRGVSITGRAEIHDDYETVFNVGAALYGR
jgi:hypothetical protein